MGLDYCLPAAVGPLTMAPSQLGIFHAFRICAASAPTSSSTCSRCRSTKFGDPLHRFPGDHGERLQSAAADLARHGAHPLGLKPAEAPAIAPNYLATGEDPRSSARRRHPHHPPADETARALLAP